MYRFFVAVLLALVMPAAAQAQYYVCISNCINGASPSDSNPGTLASPFLTIGKAQTSMAGGATKKTIIEAGTYTMGTSQFTGSANWTFSSSDSGETWVAYPGATVVISGGGSQSVNNYQIVVATGTTGLTFEGLTFQNTGGNGGTHQSGSSIGFTLNGSLATTANHVIKYNNFIGCTDYCLFLNGINGATIDSNRCQNVISADVNLGSCFASPAGINGAVNITVSHNLCENTYYACADFNGNNGSNVIHDITYDRNVVVNPCLKMIALSENDCGGLYMSDRNGTSTNMFITNNVIMGPNLDILDSNTMTSKGIYLDDCASNVTVSGNLLFNNTGLFPIFLHGSHGVSVTNNVFVLASGGSSGAELGGYQTASACAAGANGSTMNGNSFTKNVVWFQGGWPGSGPWETLSTSPTNFPSISGNLYYMQTGVSFRNNTTNFVDSSPIVCGPSMGASPLGNITPQELWGMMGNGTISTWQDLARNQGPTVRTCAAGGF